jgi:hypothetical protein
MNGAVKTGGQTAGHQRAKPSHERHLGYGWGRAGKAGKAGPVYAVHLNVKMWGTVQFLLDF